MAADQSVRIGGRYSRSPGGFQPNHIGRKDQGLYATHGAYIANTGKLRFDLLVVVVAELASPDQLT